jgi:hypothetical protein
MLQLLPGLHEQVTTRGWKLDENAFPSIASPYVKAWVSRTAMDSQEIKISVKAGEYGIFLIIFHEIGGCRCQEMGTRHSEDGRNLARVIVPISSSVCKGFPRQA